MENYNITCPYCGSRDIGFINETNKYITYECQSCGEGYIYI